MPAEIGKLCIIAGNGSLPSRIATEYPSAFILAIEGAAEREWVEEYDHEWIKLGEVGKAISLLKKNSITDIVFAGGVKKPDFRHIKADKEGLLLLGKIMKSRILGDDSILSSITSFLKNMGFKIRGAEEILPNLIVNRGVLGAISPNLSSENDIKLGIEVLESLSRFDIGQSIIVSNSLVIGIEAIEGTDKLIKRCAKFPQVSGGVLIKLPKINQNKKVDLPTIGTQTIENIAKAKIKGIAIRAKETIIIDRENVINLADKLGIFIIAK